MVRRCIISYYDFVSLRCIWQQLVVSFHRIKFFHLKVILGDQRLTVCERKTTTCKFPLEDARTSAVVELRLAGPGAMQAIFKSTIVDTASVNCALLENRTKSVVKLLSEQCSPRSYLKEAKLGPGQS